MMSLAMFLISGAVAVWMFRCAAVEGSWSDGLLGVLNAIGAFLNLLALVLT